MRLQQTIQTYVGQSAQHAAHTYVFKAASTHIHTHLLRGRAGGLQIETRQGHTIHKALSARGLGGQSLPLDACGGDEGVGGIDFLCLHAGQTQAFLGVWRIVFGLRVATGACRKGGKTKDCGLFSVC